MPSTELGKTYDINTFLYTLFQKKSSAANWGRILKNSDLRTSRMSTCALILTMLTFGLVMPKLEIFFLKLTGFRSF